MFYDRMWQSKILSSLSPNLFTFIQINDSNANNSTNNTNAGMQDTILNLSDSLANFHAVLLIKNPEMSIKIYNLSY